MMRRRVLVVLTALGAGSLAFASPYWVAWEGDDYPENQGWERWWGDASNPSGLGAIRTLANGAMTIDSLYNNQIWDASTFAASTLPGSGELFRAEWSVLIDPASDLGDAEVVVSRGEPYLGVALEFGPAQLHIVDLDLTVPYAISQAHAFRLESDDGTNFRLWMDGVQVGAGPFSQIGLPWAAVSFGDGVVGQRSKSTWDYMRFGIVPEPSGAMLLSGATVCAICLTRCARGSWRAPNRAVLWSICAFISLLAVRTGEAQPTYRQWNLAIDPNSYDLRPLDGRIIIKTGSNTQQFRFESFDPNGQPADIGWIETDSDGAGRVDLVVRGDPSQGRLVGAKNLQGIDLRFSTSNSYLSGMRISGNVGSFISVKQVAGAVSIDGSLNGYISVDEITNTGSIAIDGQVSANSSINTSNAMAGTLIAYGSFLGVCNFGSLTGTLDFRKDLAGAVNIADQLNGQIRINGPLVNGSAAEDVVIGSVGPAGAVTVDWDGADVGDDWQSGAIVKVGGTSYTGNTPGQKLYEVSECLGDLNNDEIVDFFDIDPLVMAFDPAAYDANFPGFSGSRVYHGDCDCDGDVDFFDIDPFVANLGECFYDCNGGRAARGSFPMTALDPQSLADNLLSAVAPERTTALLAAVHALADAPPAGSAIDWDAVRTCMSGE